MNDDKWLGVKALLKGRLTSGQYNRHFSASTAILGDSGLIISLNNNSLDMVKNRLSGVVKDSVSKVYGDVAISYQAQLPGVPPMAESKLDSFNVVDEDVAPFTMLHNKLLDSGHVARMSPTPFALYVALKRFAGSKQNAWPSYQTLADMVGISRSGAIRHIRTLAELGYIRVEHCCSDNGRFTSNTIYILKLPNI